MNRITPEILRFVKEFQPRSNNKEDPPEVSVETQKINLRTDQPFKERFERFGIQFLRIKNLQTYFSITKGIYCSNHSLGSRNH